ncbi:MAG: radical SAM protein [Firmicutes bacterium]|nr:radical SAM protein [Bacillota bacterium]
MVAAVALQRERKSRFVKLFDKTPAGVNCPHFHELVLSNGCPYDCTYCYLRLTFRGNKAPVLFNNGWEQVKSELDAAPGGVFSTGELADSLAVTPPLLDSAIDYFAGQTNKYLLLVTKSTNTRVLTQRDPSPQIIVSFSVNSTAASALYEPLCPSREERLLEAAKLRDLGWRVRIRLDPIIEEAGIPSQSLLPWAHSANTPGSITTLGRLLERVCRDRPMAECGTQ